jgi:hypothetical protein
MIFYLEILPQKFNADGLLTMVAKKKKTEKKD